MGVAASSLVKKVGIGTRFDIRHSDFVIHSGIRVSEFLRHWSFGLANIVASQTRMKNA
jgi:hypothetical protein